MDPIKELKNYLKGKSITKAAKELGVSRQTIYNWLNGTHSFTLKNWKKLAKN
jgi:transposase